MTLQLARRYKLITAIGIALLLGLLLSQGARAQNPITARAEPTRLTIDEQLTLNITISGDFLTIPNPDLAQLQDFVVVSSSTSTQVSIINGKMSSQKIFIYRLQPLKEGNLVIGAISVNLGGQIYQTDPIPVEVLGSSALINPPGEDIPETEAPDTLQGQDFFIEAEVSNPTPYLGEQIIYTFRLYQATNFFGQPDYHPPSFTDFWSSEILAQPHYNTEAGGRQYLVTEILTALFPANLGNVTIQPATLVIPGGLFSPDVKLETNPVEVEVRPLPPNAPEDFTGAVGQFEISASLSQTETKVNEPVTLLIEIEGAGNIQTLVEPQLPDLPNWRVFESQASTTTETGSGGMTGKRSFERLIVPGRPGQHTFPAISFSYYDPQAEAYRTIATDPILLTVQPDDSAPPPPPVPASDDNNPLPAELPLTDIRHIKPAPSSLSTAGGWSTAGWSVFACLWVAPMLMVGAVQVWRKRQLRLQHDIAFARDVRARRTAFKILSDAQNGGVTRQADAAGRALLGYLSDKLNKPTAGLTTEGLINLLRESGLDLALIERVREILHRIDVGRFAPITEGDGQSIMVDTQHLINSLEKALGKRR